MNKVILIGRLTKDSELKYTESEMAVCSFSLAVDREFKKDEADFINCKAFNKLAQTISQYTKKGDLIAISGRINTGSYEKNGEKRYNTDVIVDSIKFLQTKKNEVVQEPTQQSDPYKDFGEIVEKENFDLPF